MTDDLLDEAEREACERLLRAGSPPAPQHRAVVYGEAVMRLVDASRREREDFYDAYLRVLAQPSPTLVALVLIHRDQFEREKLPVMH